MPRYYVTTPHKSSPPKRSGDECAEDAAGKTASRLGHLDSHHTVHPIFSRPQARSHCVRYSSSHRRIDYSAVQEDTAQSHSRQHHDHPTAGVASSHISVQITCSFLVLLGEGECDDNRHDETTGTKRSGMRALSTAKR
nr:hypothetical protein CFP56_62775 [Quercus suber]